MYTRARPLTGLPRCNAERWNNHLNFEGTCLISHPMWLFSPLFLVCASIYELMVSIALREKLNEKKFELYSQWMNEKKVIEMNILTKACDTSVTTMSACVLCITTLNNFKHFFLYTKRWFRTMFGITLLVVHCTVHIQYTWGAWNIECTMFSYILQGFKTLFSCRERERKPMSVILVLILEKIFRNKYT